MHDRTQKHRYFSILGDSVSTLFGYSQPPEAVFYTAARRYETEVYYMADTWWGQVIDALGGELLTNDSFSGSTVSYDPRYEIEAYGCSDLRTSGLGVHENEPDVIMVLMGINDRGLGVPLRPSCEAERGELTVFSEAYSAMLNKLRANYPHAEVWCLTLPLGSIDGRVPEGQGRQNKAYCEVIAECAAQEGCRLIDICRMEPYESIDGLHPSARGMRQIANAVLAALMTGGL